MIGQSHISKTLLNALRNGRLPHALLFTGIRGTGKTSSARILAKSIRCQNAKDFVPCGVCTDCIEIATGKSLDVIEIDGASNNGVDSIRDLRDSVMFSSSTGKYKIFIIDEVHMLSTSAFNALLKTLEEPPEHVIFVMATTEVQKIPQTILSRCQRFDFKRVGIKDLAAHLKWICQQEQFEIEEKALWLIARQGEGSVRDSLSLLDQVINFSQALKGQKILASDVSSILGLTERSLVFEAFESLINRDSEKMVKLLNKIAVTSFNSNLFIEDLLRLFRHAIMIKASKSNLDTVIDLPTDEIQILQEATVSLGQNDLQVLFDMTLKSLADITRAHDPLLVLEVCLLRMAQSPQVKDLIELIGQKKTSFEGSVAAETPKAKAPLGVEPKKKDPIFAKPNAETWFELVKHIKIQDAFLGAKVENLVYTGCDQEKKQIHFEVSSAYGFLTEQMKQAETVEKLQAFIDSYFGSGYTFNVVKTQQTKGESAVKIEKQKMQQEQQKKEDEWLQDSRVKKAQEIFKGRAKLLVKNEE